MNLEYQIPAGSRLALKETCVPGLNVSALPCHTLSVWNKISSVWAPWGSKSFTWRSIFRIHICNTG